MANKTINTGLEIVDTAFNNYLSHILGALIIFFIGFIIGRLLGKLVYKVLHDIGLDRIIKETLQTEIELEKPLEKIVSYFIYFIAVVMAFNEIGLTTTVFTIIIAAMLILLVVTVALSIKDFIPNAIAGLIIMKKRNIKEGDRIEVANAKGKVSEISLLETKIETSKKDTIFIPNATLVRSRIRKKR